MKNLFFITILTALICQPFTRAMAQNQSKNTSQVIGELILAIALSDNNKTAKKPAKKQNTVAVKKSYIRSELFGVWEFDDCLVFIESNGNYSVTTPSYGEVLFSGTYKYADNVLTVYDNYNAFFNAWKIIDVNIREKLVMKPKSGGFAMTGKYKCSVKRFFDQKDRELANLTSNAEIYVTQQQSYVQSKSIRNDVQHAATRRTYDAERTKALENAKYYRRQGNEAQARAWEEKAEEWEDEIRKLDGN